MEKRVILAFGLILLIWVLTPFYQEYILGRIPTTPSSVEEPPPTPEESPSVPATPPQQQSTVETHPQPQETTDEVNRDNDNWDRDIQLITMPTDSSESHRQIVVEGDLFRGVFDTRGGVIRSWQLKRYEGIESPWVELIPEDRGGGPDILLTSENGILDFSQVTYETRSNDIVLNRGKDTGNLEFRYVSPSGIGLVKRFTFNNDDYAFATDIELLDGNQNKIGNKYFIRWGGGIRITEPDRERDLYAFRAFRRVGEEVEEQEFDEEEPESYPFSGETRWVGVRSKYFFIGVIPMERSGVGSRLSGRPIIKESINDRQIAAELEMEISPVLQEKFLIYLGPVDYDLLEGYGLQLEEVVNLGWSFIKPISRIILSLLVWLHQWISNYGMVIVVLSIMVKIVLYPLTYKSMMATQGMQTLQPKMEELKAKHKNDAQKLNKEMMKLYKEQGVNPIGGCLPMLLQMPILYALYAIFRSTIELRRAPLGWWIEDLSQKDAYWILPALMGLTMLLQSKMTMKAPNQAALVYIMPVMLFFFMKDLPSGLVLYWTMVNVLTIIQQFLQNRFLPPSPAKA